MQIHSHSASQFFCSPPNPPLTSSDLWFNGCRLLPLPAPCLSHFHIWKRALLKLYTLQDQCALFVETALRSSFNRFSVWHVFLEKELQSCLKEKFFFLLMAFLKKKDKLCFVLYCIALYCSPMYGIWFITYSIFIAIILFWFINFFMSLYCWKWQIFVLTWKHFACFIVIHQHFNTWKYLAEN